MNIYQNIDVNGDVVIEGKADFSTLGVNAANAVNQQLAVRLLELFPIGTLIMSPTDPASVIGGSWQQVQDAFIVAAGTEFESGTTGGSLTHNHNFQIGMPFWYGAAIGDNFQNAGAYKYSTGEFGGDGGEYPTPGTAYTVLRNNSFVGAMQTQNTAVHVSVGDTDTASSLPPYEATNVWKRIA